MLTLYHFVNSVASQKVRIALHAKNLDFETREVALFESAQFAPEYLKLNPKGYVPTLIHDGKAIGESTVICEYLEDAFSDHPLRPAEPHERARMRLWSKAVDDGLHVGITMISFSAMFRERMKTMPEDIRERRFLNIGDPARRDRFESSFELGVDSPYVFRAIADYEIAFRDIEAALESGDDWLAGGAFSLAEINLAPYVARLDYLQLLPIWTAERPLLRAWWDRVKAEPAVQRAIADVVSPTEIDEMAVFGGKLHDRMAERRDEYLIKFRIDPAG
ncbi:MAG: glutathione S-transferase family protein [Rhodospirillales bacterium]|nr:glutathione S-transferase family protein [Rhodospirillales bacterium]